MRGSEPALLRPMIVNRRTAPGWVRRAKEWGGRDDGAAEVAQSGGARLVFGPGQRLALLAGFALLVALRIPLAWLHGRFMDEEGTIFFAYAWHREAGEALLRSFGGYLNIGANATALLTARLVRGGALPLELAPYLTMVLALLVQMVPAILILTGRGRWLASRWAVIGALLVVAIVPRVEEVFFNVLHIQFHLALAAALILALETPRGRAARIGYAAILFLAPLCGPGAIILLPFFGLRWLLERERGRLEQTIALTAGVAVQMLAFFTPSPVRGKLLHPITLGPILLVRFAVMPLVGSGKANRLGRVIHDHYLAGDAGWWLAVLAAVLYFGLLIGLALHRYRDPATWLIVPGLAIAAMSFGGGMIDSDSREWFSVGAGERYNFLPLVLLTLGLIVLGRRTRGWYRGWCVAICLATLLSGATAFPRPIEELATGPVWSDEVAAWRRDHDHPLATWPKNWTIDLSDRDRPCHPPRPGGAETGDPSYCESAWLTRVVQAIARDKARPDA